MRPPFSFVGIDRSTAKQKPAMMPITVRELRFYWRAVCTRLKPEQIDRVLDRANDNNAIRSTDAPDGYHAP